MARKLIGSTFVSLDGVVDDPQVWGPPYWDAEHNRVLLRTHTMTSGIVVHVLGPKAA